MGVESRVHPRLRVKAKADVIGDEVILGRALWDLSMSGCSFDGAGWEREGREVQLVLNFPAQAANLPLNGVIVRSSPRDMGIRFHRLSDEQKWTLRKHIREAQTADG